MTPFAMWTQMWLNSGQRVLDSMATVAKQSRPKVAVIPTPDAPRRRRKAKARRRAKRSR